MLFLRCATQLGALFVVLAALPAAAAHRDLIMVSIGHSDIEDFDEPTVEASIEYTSRKTVWGNATWFSGFGPMLGLTMTGKGAFFAYGGLYGDFFIGDSLVIRPEVGLGAFTPGNGKDLGGTFEIHDSLSMVYVFDNEARFGVTYSHISNAGVHASNPAVDSVLLTYAFPIGPVF